MKELIKHLIYTTTGTTSFVRRIEWRKMLNYLNLKEGEKILDVACGDAILSHKIAERGCKVYGIDISKDAIEAARSFAKEEGINCEFMVGNAEDLPYSDEYFDKIVCSSSLEHFNNDIKALNEMNRVLKLGGLVVMTVDSLTYPISDEVKEMHRKMSNVVNYYTHGRLEERFKIVDINMNRSEYLLNSHITSFFFNIGIKMKWSGKVWMIISFIAYPLCLVSDRLFGVKNKGYTLIAAGKKVNSS